MFGAGIFVVTMKMAGNSGPKIIIFQANVSDPGYMYCNRL
jgi:hypothetical protein